MNRFAMGFFKPSMFFTRIIPFLFFLITTLFPFYWMSVTAIKPNPEVYNSHNPLWVFHPTLSQFNVLLFRTEFLKWFLNSVIVSVAVTLLALVLGSLAAYALARIKFFGRGVIGKMILFTYLIPRVLLFIPLYTIIAELRLENTLASLILSFITFVLPFCTWLLIGYFQNIPVAMEESAMIDGCNRLRILFQIIWPSTLPGLISAAIFSFTLSWDEFIYPLIFISSSGLKTIPTGIAALEMGDVFMWGQIMSAGFLASVPLLILYGFVQKFLVKGLTAGAVKG